MSGGLLAGQRCSLQHSHPSAADPELPFKVNGVAVNLMLLKKFARQTGAEPVDRLTGMTTDSVPIWFESIGDRAQPAVLLVMGQGGQAISWDDEFCQSICHKGFRVIRFDNRDAGLSGSSETDYLLRDMAHDAGRVLDALGVTAAHVVGQSMGGMIAQQMAIDSPDRVLSLSLLSTSPELDIAPLDPRMEQVVVDLRNMSKHEWIDVVLRSIRIQTGSLWPFDEQLVRIQIESEVERAFRPKGGIRQMKAVLASPARTDALATIAVPTLVVHGDEDPAFPTEHAYALAESIPNARLHIIDGMGHAVPWGHWDHVLGVLLPHLDSAMTL